jgi:hypothetical protein
MVSSRFPVDQASDLLVTHHSLRRNFRQISKAMGVGSKQLNSSQGRHDVAQNCKGDTYH